jgi:hypothetical protein
VVEHLLANGANLVRLNGWNEGAIDLAASAGYWELVALLRNRSLQGKVCVCVCVCMCVSVCLCGRIDVFVDVDVDIHVDVSVEVTSSSN